MLLNKGMIAALLAVTFTMTGCVAPPPRERVVYHESSDQGYSEQDHSGRYCHRCGTVRDIDQVEIRQRSSGGGAVLGAIIGGVIGNQFGHGGGRTAMTLLGAVGGGFAGNSVEKHLRTSTAYSVRVRMETGKYRYFTFHEAPPFQQGERVRIENGTLVAG